MAVSQTAIFGPARGNTVTIAAAPYTFSNLPGADATILAFELSYRFKFTSGSATVALQINADSGANYKQVAFFDTLAASSVPASVASTPATFYLLNEGVGTAGYIEGTVEVKFPQAGDVRPLTSDCLIVDTGASTMATYRLMGHWTNTASAVTSLQIVIVSGTLTGTANYAKLRTIR